METILAISPGTRLLGIAIFQDEELRDWKIHSFYQKWSGKKLRQILKLLDQYIVEYRVTKVVIKIPDRISDSKGLDLILGGINVLCENIGQKAAIYGLANIKNAFSREVIINKRELERLIAIKFPDLAFITKLNAKNKGIYYERAFEAVGAGYCFYSERKTK